MEAALCCRSVHVKKAENAFTHTHAHNAEHEEMRLHFTALQDRSGGELTLVRFSRLTIVDMNVN